MACLSHRGRAAPSKGRCRALPEAPFPALGPSARVTPKKARRRVSPLQPAAPGRGQRRAGTRLDPVDPTSRRSLAVARHQTCARNGAAADEPRSECSLAPKAESVATRRAPGRGQRRAGTRLDPRRSHLPQEPRRRPTSDLCWNATPPPMNLLLLAPDELSADGTARLTGDRLRHLREVLGVRAGSTLRAGVLGGDVGTAEILALNETEAVLRPVLDRPPPPRPGIDLVLALPRPKALRRILAASASMGIDRLVLLAAARVEKSYLASPVLQLDRIRKHLLDGLEQAQDTVLPEVHLEPRFRPFVEDRMDALLGPGERWLLHPGDEGPRSPSDDGSARPRHRTRGRLGPVRARAAPGARLSPARVRFAHAPHRDRRPLCAGVGHGATPCSGPPVPRHGPALASCAPNGGSLTMAHPPTTPTDAARSHAAEPVTSEPQAKPASHDTAPPPALLDFMMQELEAGAARRLPPKLSHARRLPARRRALSQALSRRDAASSPPATRRCAPTTPTTASAPAPTSTTSPATSSPTACS